MRFSVCETLPFTGALTEGASLYLRGQIRLMSKKDATTPTRSTKTVAPEYVAPDPQEAWEGLDRLVDRSDQHTEKLIASKTSDQVARQKK